MLAVVLELLWTLLQVIFHCLRSIILTITPTSLIAKDVSGKLVLITGAGGGLGSRLAVNLAGLGCRLVLWDVNSSLNQATRDKVESLGAQVWSYTVDLCDSGAVERAARQVDKEVGHVDILINNAGVVYGRSVLESRVDQIERTLHVNSLAHFWTVKSFLPSMLERKSGHIVSVASTAGLTGVPGMADYCASKYAAVGFAETLSMELRKCGGDVKSTVVCPYLIDTGMFDGCQPRFPLILDTLKPQFVADQTTDAILRNQEMLVLPRMLNVMFFFKAILPLQAQMLLNDFAGVMDFMDTFVHKEKHS